MQNERGSSAVPLIIVSTLLVGALCFGLWAFMSMVDYRTNVDQKVAEGVEAAKVTIAAEEQAKYDEREKSPYQTYQGPVTFGTLKLTYPKTWSAYVDESANSGTPITGYAHPNYVPSINSQVSFALRFEVLNTNYQNILQQFDSNVRIGKLKASAFRATTVPDTLGTKLEGELAPQKQGVMVILPLRDKTIKVWTEGNEYRADFTTILESLNFVP